MATNNKPANQLRCGYIEATIWQNSSEKGRISPEHGAMGLRTVSMTLRRWPLWLIKQPLMP